MLFQIQTMGIPSLNYYFRTACPEAIKHITLKSLEGKTIVIDISIYLYKFKGDGDIIENMYIMCTLFKKYNITPIFIFDGKPPPEKYKTIKRRKDKKEAAEREYNLTKAQLEKNISYKKKKEIQLKMKHLKKQFIRVKNWEIRAVKKLIEFYGFDYIEAECEADMLCAKMVIDGRADACLSDDMDLFVYGCPRVLRYLTLKNEQVSLYDLSKILQILEISMKDFRRLCILAGTDYSPPAKRKTFYYYFTLYKKYRDTEADNFYSWLQQYKLLVDGREKLESIECLFDTNKIDIPEYTNNTIVDREGLRKLLERENFIFPPRDYILPLASAAAAL